MRLPAQPAKFDTDDAETGDDILLTMLDALSDSQRRRLTGKLGPNRLTKESR